MKNKFIIGFVLVLLAALSSCTLEKRHYRKGFYVDWNHVTTKTNETVALSEPPTRESTLSTRIVQYVDTTSVEVDAKQPDQSAPVAPRTKPAVVCEPRDQETPVDPFLNAEKATVPTPIETDKKQAVGAGVAAAIFFVLGMVGLIIKGTAPPTGVFIGAAFLCCVLCIVLASFLYPRDPVVKQPKDEAVVQNQGVLAAGLGLLIAVVAVFLLVVGLFFSIFTDLLF